MLRYIAKFQNRFDALFEAREEGATAVEYGLMVALIAAVIIGAVGLIGTNLTGLFNGVAGSLVPAAPAG